MGTQEFVEIVHNVCNDVLPIVGVIVLIYLILFLRKLIDTMKNLDHTLSQTDTMINDCNKQINKLDGPLETMNDLSNTVDSVHEATKSALTSTAALILTNLGSVKDWFLNKTKKDEVMNESEDDDNE